MYNMFNMFDMYWLPGSDMCIICLTCYTYYTYHRHRRCTFLPFPGTAFLTFLTRHPVDPTVDHSNAFRSNNTAANNAFDSKAFR